MNRGTALKWVDCLEKTTHEFEPTQLMFKSDNIIFASPCGILCEFIDKNYTLAWDKCSLIWKGQQFYLPECFRKKSKIKSNFDEKTYEFYTFSHIIDRRNRTPPEKEIEDTNSIKYSLLEIFEILGSHKLVSEFIKDNYEGI